MTSTAMPASLSRSSSTSSTSFNTPNAVTNSTASVANNGVGGNNNLTNSNSTSSTFNSNYHSYPLNASNTSHNFHNANYNSTVAQLDHTVGNNLNTNSSNSALSSMQPNHHNQLTSMATLTGHHSSKDRPNLVSSPSTNKHRLRGFTDSVTSGMSHSSISAIGDGVHNIASPRTPNLKHDVSAYQASVDSQFPYVGTHSPTVTGSEFLQKSISDTKLDSNAEKEMSSDGLTGSSTPFSKSFSSSKPSKKESLREQKKFYRQEKKKFAQEIMSTLNDPSIEMIANFLKVRTNLKTWIRLYCVLKPGLLVLYRSQKTNKSGQWVATVLLSACQLMERPSKKDGFCFKLFHPLEQSIWALRGPHGESTSLMGLNLPSCYLIFRALSDSDGKCWMDHLELTMKIAPARLKSSMNENAQNDSILTSPVDEDHDYEFDHDPDDKIHFRSDALFDNETEEVLESENDDAGNRQHLDSSSTVDPDPNEPSTAPNSPGIEMGPLGKPVEAKYILAPPEVMGDLEGGGQEESVHGENKSLILTLVKQVKPGMDLSKVVLPTFILEPRSFLDKLSDYYYHCDMISSAIAQDDPFERMKSIVIFYLAGFYKKPKGLKKPYNPILGEYFRCYWQHPSGSKTFYIAEQVSHHPPISTFHVSNRAEGFAISGTILAKSRFYGTSVSALFDGTAKLTLLTKGEDYDITFPYAFCKGILFGTLSMELGGKVHVSCEKTGYHTDIEFKLKPYLFGGKDSTNAIMGHISLGGKKLASIEGKWDGEIFMTDFRGSSPERSMIWAVTSEVKSKRLPRYVIDFSEQDEFESEKLWSKVEKAINSGNQNLATEEKFVLEDRQRKEAKSRAATGETWETKFFREDPMGSGQYIYKFSDYRPWDKENDMRQYENRGVIRTLTKHKIAPLVRSSGAHNGGNSRRPSLGTGLQSSLDTPVEADEEETSGDERWPNSVSETPVGCDQGPAKKTSITVPPAPQPRVQSRASGSAGRSPVGSPTHETAGSVAIARKLSEVLDENTKAINMLRHELMRLRNERNRAFNIMTFIITVAIAVLVQIFFQYFSHLFQHS